jgi:catechol 2,3-dioxygenase-like lactoylglutathione lyase family enzyme
MVTVFVTNMSESVRFYTEALGMALEARYGDEFAMLKADDGLAVGLHPATPASPAGKITIGLRVPGRIQDAVASLQAKGVKFRSPIVDDKEVIVATFEDPNGAELYLAEVTSG